MLLIYGKSVVGQNQTTVMPGQLGYAGLVYTPSANMAPWKTADIGFTHFSRTISKTYNAGETSERSFLGSIVFLPFLEVSLKLTRPYQNETDQLRNGKRYRGIGDRSISLRVQVLKETARRPALAIGIQDPFPTNSDFFNTQYAVISKSFRRNGLTLASNLGFGYTSDDEAFLKGIFGGFNLSWKYLNLMAEYDTQYFNAGIGLHFKEIVFLQIAMIDGRGYSGNLNVRFQLK